MGRRMSGLDHKFRAQGAYVVFSCSRLRAPGEHGEEATFSSKESKGPELLGIKERTLPSPAREQELKGNKEHYPPAGDQEF
jgi:hypothetical protein